MSSIYPHDKLNQYINNENFSANNHQHYQRAYRLFPPTDRLKDKPIVAGPSTQRRRSNDLLRPPLPEHGDQPSSPESCKPDVESIYRQYGAGWNDRASSEKETRRHRASHRILTWASSRKQSPHAERPPSSQLPQLQVTQDEESGEIPLAIHLRQDAKPSDRRPLKLTMTTQRRITRIVSAIRTPVSITSKAQARSPAGDVEQLKVSSSEAKAPAKDRPANDQTYEGISSKTCLPIRKTTIFLATLLLLAVIDAIVMNAMFVKRRPAISQSFLTPPTNMTLASDCPARNGRSTTGIYGPTGRDFSFLATCNQDCNDTSIAIFFTYSLDLCMDACLSLTELQSTPTLCKAVTFRSDMAAEDVQKIQGNCQLKTGCTQPGTGNGNQLISAILATF